MPVEQRLSWDPRHEPCIPVVKTDGAEIALSLCELFGQADGLSTISCATAGEAVAVIEYLLAICFAAEICPATPEEWKEWVLDGHDLGRASEWLADEPEDDWNMFHPEKPLGQNSLLIESFTKSSTGTAQLVIERTGDYNQFFDHHHLEDGEPLPAAQAFRAMLTQHAYATYGRARMTGEDLGPTVTNLATGRLQGRIRVVALGSTLGETLRLNLYPYKGAVGKLNTSWTSGSVTRRTFDKKAVPRVPDSPADLHSALGRSVLLHPALAPDGSIVVNRVLIGAGEVLALDDELHLQDAVFVQPASGPPKPLWPSPTRALWQEAHALYSAVKAQQPGLYKRLASLPYKRKDRSAPYQLWAVGLIANKTLPVTWTDGHFPYAPGMAAHLYRASRRGSRIAEYLAWSLKRAATIASETVHSAAHAADEARQVARFDARWMFWPAAAKPFDRLLDQVIEEGFDNPDDPVSSPLAEYTRVLLDSARTHLVYRLDSLPPNKRGYEARARALRRFEDDVAHDKAPAELRGEIAHD
ncbi:type I-E CRISPR-associated protein Cse1/CasA [Streptomyces avicenniae]|uniref:type I-E CRISPR-associated protein Cse1/CasA n=1 Tax=Streptomyces avicenniae TaxID=500153 RepID=UPI000DA61B17|nr:type I-E CRISPR-associated protein Cse1/CasA [Streptomyces avicenniae]